MTILIDRVNRFSSGARNLARKLNAKILKPFRSKYKARPTDTVINWGHSTARVYRTRAYYNFRGPRIINPPEAVAIASDKGQTFRKIQEWNALHPNDPVTIPDVAYDLNTARAWEKDGLLIASRALLRASQGKGMVVSPQAQSTVSGVPTRLWTKYIRGREFRVHVFRGRVIDIQQKKHRRETEANSLIRNYANGWVFCREGVQQLPEIPAISNLAIKACQAVGLDFGAVDIRYNLKKQKAYFLEVNTTPGLEGTTLNSYAKAIAEGLL